jgi:hypothetical protein
MKEVGPERDFAVTTFQVGLATDVVAVFLNLRTRDSKDLEKIVIRLTPAMAETLAGHLQEASAAASLGDVVTPVRQ